MPTVAAPRHPKILLPGEVPTPEHIQFMWPGHGTLPLEDCLRLRSILELCAFLPAPKHKRKGPTPVADAYETLRRAIERAQAHLTGSGPALPVTTSANVSSRLRLLKEALDAVPLDWLLEPSVSVVQVAWQNVCNAVYETALAARIHASQPAGRPHAKDLTILFVFGMLTSVRLGPEHEGCSSPGALSQFIRGTFAQRPFETLIARIEANDSADPGHSRAWSTASDY